MAQAVVDDRRKINTRPLGLYEQAEGVLGLRHVAVGCSNDECKKTTIFVSIGVGNNPNGTGFVLGKELLFEQRIIPQGSAKPQPNFVPEAVREDYYEACAICDLSPKASATLTRRCLQGVIRDFCGISKKRLIDEITELRRQVDAGEADRAISMESVEAIDQVRSIGNIGAHMEADISVIVPVDSGEAQALIDLTELLFDEWYGERHRRQVRLAKITAIKAEKDELKHSPKNISV